MIKSVQNVTSKSLKIVAETALSPKTQFELRLIAGGIYQLEPSWVYPTLNEYIKNGELLVLDSDSDSTVEVANTEDSPAEATEDLEEPTEETSDTADSVPGDDEEAEEPVDLTSTTFVCDICGEEFGSARGLQSHKSRAHK